MKTIVLNQKNYLNYKDTMAFKNELEKINNSNIKLIYMPNILYLTSFKGSKTFLGAQNFYSYNHGAYTGEICLESLKEIGVQYTLVGHPERLNMKLDTYIEAKNKLFKSLNSGFKTILCVGKDENIKTLKKELKFYLSGLECEVLKNLIIAFEPISKIEGEIIDLNEIESFNNVIKSYIKKHFEIEVPFIYGGSVDKDNIKEVINLTDGVLLGTSSLNINNLKEIVKIIK